MDPKDRLKTPKIVLHNFAGDSTDSAYRATFANLELLDLPVAMLKSVMCALDGTKACFKTRRDVLIIGNFQLPADLDAFKQKTKKTPYMVFPFSRVWIRSKRPSETIEIKLLLPDLEEFTEKAKNYFGELIQEGILTDEVFACAEISVVIPKKMKKIRVN